MIGTPDADKWWPRRIVEWVYALVMSFADNTIKTSVRNGDYKPDTTAEPYASLRAYKGRSLNGIWATAPYLHNGSVPTLWDLLNPAEKRPKSFKIGVREFDPVNVGFKNDRRQFQYDSARQLQHRARLLLQDKAQGGRPAPTRLACDVRPRRRLQADDRRAARSRAAAVRRLHDRRPGAGPHRILEVPLGLSRDGEEQWRTERATI